MLKSCKTCRHYSGLPTDLGANRFCFECLTAEEALPKYAPDELTIEQNARDNWAKYLKVCEAIIRHVNCLDAETGKPLTICMTQELYDALVLGTKVYYLSPSDIDCTFDGMRINIMQGKGMKFVVGYYGEVGE